MTNQIISHFSKHPLTVTVYVHTLVAAGFLSLAQKACVGRVSIQQCAGIQLYDRNSGQSCSWGMQFYEGLYNQQWTSVFTINELQLPECWYPENWKGLEWHLLNPGAQILAAAQSSEFSTRVKHHNKCTLSCLYSRLSK